ncbi:MAG: RIP metalloprotease RseP [Gloeocapsa sp. DLM2.Bin57]|nr:MAG: RIP metalloprotease RseP [Gloeocapsa sp. DLM2.Bin57]
MPILAAIAVLAILIIVHELGHFAAARLQGIYVNRFAIGFGPALLKYKGSQTEYSVRAFPLGGYVAFPDDEPDSNIPPDDPNLLRNRPILDRAIVISAGVIANLIFAYFLLVVQSGTIGFQSIDYQPGVIVPQVLNESTGVAATAGIKPGDIITGIDSLTLPASSEGITTLRDKIQQSANQPLELTITRDTEEILVTVIPQESEDGKGKIGVMLSPNGEVVRKRAQNPLEAIVMGADEFQRIATLTVQGFSQLLLNFQESARQVAGPVAIVAVGAQLAKDNLGNLFQFAALISINLAIINILPLPALDGGQLLFLLIEGVFGKPLPARLQEGIMQTGLFLLLGLGMFLIIRDTANLAFFQQLFQ